MLTALSGEKVFGYHFWLTGHQRSSVEHMSLLALYAKPLFMFINRQRMSQYN